MDLGAFSVSLSVRDLAVSREFYEKLGFTQFGGNAEENWLIMKNGSTVIGLFQGMFEGTMLTFNPGWDQDAQPLESFTDVREVQTALQAAGVPLLQEADAAGVGPASLVLTDPDGNTILIDQHV
jgi:lactoylglutathione lyase